MTDTVNVPREPAGAGEREKLIQDLSDAERWRRLPGSENHLATAALLERAISALRAQPQAREDVQPVEVTILCPECAMPHVDEGEWATTRHHKTHQCQGCGHEWRPFPFATVGVAHPATQTAPESEKLRAAVEAFMPTNIDLSNASIRDDLVLPIDVTVGELRAISKALSAAPGEADQ